MALEYIMYIMFPNSIFNTFCGICSLSFVLLEGNIFIKFIPYGNGEIISCFLFSISSVIHYNPSERKINTKELLQTSYLWWLFFQEFHISRVQDSLQSYSYSILLCHGNTKISFQPCRDISENMSMDCISLYTLEGNGL